MHGITGASVETCRMGKISIKKGTNQLGDSFPYLCFNWDYSLEISLEETCKACAMSGFVCHYPWTICEPGSPYPRGKHRSDGFFQRLPRTFSEQLTTTFDSFLESFQLKRTIFKEVFSCRNNNQKEFIN